MTKTEAEPIRDPQNDRLLTPQNCAVALIDFQPEQYGAIGSTSREIIDLGVVNLARLAAAYDVPTIVSTVGVGMGVNKPTVSEIVDVLPSVEEIDRTGVNAWEDEDFRKAIEATGRRKIVMAGLWTEVCLAYPTLDMLGEGYEVYPVVDAVGGLTTVTHETALTRMVEAGSQPITTIAFGAELMRNWARPDADKFRQVLNDYMEEPNKLGLDKPQG